MTRGDRPIVHGEDIRGAPKSPVHRRVTMKKDVWKYGLLSGLALAILVAVTMPFEHHTNARWAMAFGDTIMALSFLIVFVGVKHYRDTECNFEAMYSNPLYSAVMTLLEPLPVGMVMALVSAGVLRRKPEDGMPSAASAEAL
jgi:predicted Co/Zn/Cd cation transporter (cation efflux family)